METAPEGIFRLAVFWKGQSAGVESPRTPKNMSSLAPQAPVGKYCTAYLSLPAEPQQKRAVKLIGTKLRPDRLSLKLFLSLLQVHMRGTFHHFSFKAFCTRIDVSHGNGYRMLRRAAELKYIRYEGRKRGSRPGTWVEFLSEGLDLLRAIGVTILKPDVPLEAQGIRAAQSSKFRVSLQALQDAWLEGQCYRYPAKIFCSNLAALLEYAKNPIKPIDNLKEYIKRMLIKYRDRIWYFNIDRDPEAPGPTKPVFQWPAEIAAVKVLAEDEETRRVASLSPGKVQFDYWGMLFGLGIKSTSLEDVKKMDVEKLRQALITKTPIV